MDPFWPLEDLDDTLSLDPDETLFKGTIGISAGGLNSGGGLGGDCADVDRIREGRRAIWYE